MNIWIYRKLKLYKLQKQRINYIVSSALKSSNTYKKKGTPISEIFQYLFLLIFSNRSMYMNLLTGRNIPPFAKDTVYRFIKMIQIN